MKFIRAAAVLAAVSPAHAYHQTRQWWKEGIVYEVYPASFKESRTENAIGWGDINGITDNLDHIQSLGADIIWLAPFYDSPLRDLGYDISNYDSVNPKFGGNIEDIKRFIEEVHKRGMRCIFDLVINHTSDQHRWFLESRSNKTNPYRDFYFWRPPQYINGTRYPPNNWAGSDNGSAWWWDEHTQEYYLGLFSSFQVDVNWQNPKVRQALFEDAMRFWLDMGIDGFRMDAFFFYSKTPGLPNVPSHNHSFLDGSRFYLDGPNLNAYLRDMNEEVLSKYPGVYAVGEYESSTNITLVQEYIGASRHEINSLLLMDIVLLGRDLEQPFMSEPWNLTQLREAIDFIQAVNSPANGDAWTTIFLENHDQPRSISRFASDDPRYRVPSGRMLAMLLSTLSGTLFLHQGQEIGMINVPPTWNISDYRDLMSIAYYDGVEQEGGNLTQALANLQKLSRDNGRTPFNWNRAGGFSENATTWIPQVRKEINLADQIGDPHSVYTFWTQMTRFRKQRKDLYVYGAFEFLDNTSEQFLIYSKTSGCEKAVVILNFSKSPGVPSFEVPRNATLVATTHNRTAAEYSAFEGRVYQL